MCIGYWRRRHVRTKFCSVPISGPPPDSELKFEVMTEHSHTIVILCSGGRTQRQNKLLKMRTRNQQLKPYIREKINCHEFFEYFNESCVCEAAAGVMEMKIQGKLCIIIVKYTCDLDDKQHNVSSVNEEWIIVDVSIM